MARRVPEATVARLPVYLRVLDQALGRGISTISSDDLAGDAGVNAAQVRKDLSHLGSYGTRGVGYDVAYLVREISRQLGLGRARRVVIVGAGNLGSALAGYAGFASRGFEVAAVVDSDPARVGERVGSCTIEAAAGLVQLVSREAIDIAVVTTPASAAQAVVDSVVAAGITSVLNFAPATVRVPDHVTVRQVDLATELQVLSFYDLHPDAGRPAPLDAAHERRAG